ncbi:hypothetical protein BC629DRAFT_1030619 [Irpex lacteus]|nr:hypothetical protein BC629DRAFT_1030619 [Irpex lacteus]
MGLEKHNIPVVRKLRLIDIPKAVYMQEAALQNDPAFYYFRDTSDAKGDNWQKKWCLDLAIQLCKSVRRGQTWMVGDVLASITYELPQQTEDALDKLITRLMKLFDSKMTPKLYSKQQKRRSAEWQLKFRKAIDETVGGRKDPMWFLSELATHPDHQGHGYGSALVKMFTDQADAHGQSSWLMSSNINNTGFYNSLGFMAAADVLLGDNDPDWNAPPVVIKIMIREVPEKAVLSL